MKYLKDGKKHKTFSAAIERCNKNKNIQAIEIAIIINQTFINDQRNLAIRNYQQGFRYYTFNAKG